MIFPIPALRDNYIWAICNKQKVIIIDPGEASPVIEYLQKQQLTLAAILITHHHWDHTNGINELVDYEKNVFVSNREQLSNKLILPDFPEFTVIPIPGHTLDHTAFYAPGMVFSGDTLFSAGCGRIFEGTPEQMFSSLQTLAKLPDETQLYCGHEYTQKNLEFALLVEPSNHHVLQHLEKIQTQQLTLPSSIGLEKKINPFLRCDSLEIRKSVEVFANQELSQNIEVFTWLRKWKDKF